MKKKLIMLCSSMALVFSLAGTSFADVDPSTTERLSGFSYNSVDNVFSVDSELKNIQVTKNESHLSVSYTLEGKEVYLETEKYSSDGFVSYYGEALIDQTYKLQTDVITNEHGLSGLVYDSNQTVNHAFVIDYKGEIVNDSMEIIDTINESQGVFDVVVEQDSDISLFSTARDFTARIIHKPDEMGGIGRTGYNDGTLYYTRYTNNPDGITAYFDRLYATIEKLGPYGSFGIKNEDEMYGFVYTTPFDVTQPLQDYDIKTTSNSSKVFIFYSAAAKKATVGIVPIYTFETKELVLP
ncbi:hypothetical protein [Paenibacillus lentus]|uniref:Uncharacterized protein n=1 Tax=Paenibacillus lentus TaxID=1338368 RepID=A0A3Q8S646_9BACL|nr:hypothetical protein [Paenibacillus lentus]AZK48143.1 hypothetical protein EIM92_19845 [Paenibacillus lentus]